jgi:chaperonin GroES
VGKSKAKKPAKKTASNKTPKKAVSKKPMKKAAAKPAKKAVLKPTVQKAAAKPIKAIRSIKVSTVKWQDFVTPLDDRMIVQLNEKERVTAGGLFIPDTSSIRGQHRGTVLVVGRGHRNEKGFLRPMDVKPGDQVVFEEYAGSKANLNGVDVRIMRESEILAIVEK